MKKTYFAIIAMLFVLVTGCSKDDDEFTFIPECLASTVWEGENWDSHEFPPGHVTWVFLSTDKLQWVEGTSAKTYDYKIEGKIISFNEYYTNSWVMTKCTSTELELVRYGGSITEILKLKRQFYND